MRVGICGAGVGGLSAAIGLKALGFDVDVFERSPVLRPTGAGLNLWPNAGRAIYGLGLREQYDAISVKLDRYLNYSADGTLLFEKGTSDWPKRYGAPTVGIYRWALSSMLAEACGTERIKLGYEVTSVEDQGDKAVCHFGNGERYEGDVIIGADGINSIVREQLIGGVSFRPNDHHAYRWRAIVDLVDVDVDPAAQTGYYASGGWLSVIPIGDGRAYWFGSVSGATNVDEFVEFFDSWTNTHIPRTLSITQGKRLLKAPSLTYLEPLISGRTAASRYLGMPHTR